MQSYPENRALIINKMITNNLVDFADSADVKK